MKLSWFAFILIALTGCNNKESKKFLQDSTIKLVTPRIKATNTIIDSSVIVKAELKMKGCTLFYTTDGSDPSESSLIYNQPIKVKKEGVYKFKAFHKDWLPSKTSTLNIFKKGIIPNELNWQTNKNSAYPGLGYNTLINNKKATKNFRDKQWVGFDSFAHAKIKFKQNTFINKLTIGYLVDTKSWILPPEEIYLILNKTDSIATKIPLINEFAETSITALEIPIKSDISSIDIIFKNSILPQWHPGKGKPAWLFMDEWIFND